MVNASSNRLARWSNGNPYARYSTSFQPAPSPRMRRPSEISSTVVAFLASMAGLWKLVAATSGPSWTRVGDRCQRGEKRPRFPRPDGTFWGLVQQMVADPDRVESKVLDREPHIPQLRPPDRSLDLGQLDADGERSIGSAHEHDRTGSHAAPPHRAESPSFAPPWTIGRALASPSCISASPSSQPTQPFNRSPLAGPWRSVDSSPSGSPSTATSRLRAPRRGAVSPTLPHSLRCTGGPTTSSSLSRPSPQPPRHSCSVPGSHSWRNATRSGLRSRWPPWT